VLNASVVVLRVRGLNGLENVKHWAKDVKTHRATQDVLGTSFDTDSERVAFRFANEIPAYSEIIFHVEFSGWTFNLTL
jgi:hypothetical protein